MANKEIAREDEDRVFGFDGIPEGEYTHLYISPHYQDDHSRRFREILTEAGMLDLICPEAPWGEVVDGIETETAINVCCLYWRKDNAIHRWFVENCQQGVDDCGVYPVHPEQLAALRSACIAAAKCYDAGDMDLVREILPPQRGFFFGGVDLDDWYRESLGRTAGEIESVLNTAIQTKGIKFFYQSSW